MSRRPWTAQPIPSITWALACRLLQVPLTRTAYCIDHANDRLNGTPVFFTPRELDQINCRYVKWPRLPHPHPRSRARPRTALHTRGPVQNLRQGGPAAVLADVRHVQHKGPRPVPCMSMSMSVSVAPILAC
jgi:hypothetical protein